MCINLSYRNNKFVTMELNESQGKRISNCKQKFDLVEYYRKIMREKINLI